MMFLSHLHVWLPVLFLLSFELDHRLLPYYHYTRTELNHLAARLVILNCPQRLLLPIRVADFDLLIVYLV
eukprot:UN29522